MRGFNEKLFGDKLVAGQLPTQLGLIGSQDISDRLLDIYPNSAAAYSLRQLRTLYTGNAIRVRRSNDNAEQNIGFIGGNLDTTELTSFCSGTNGFVTTWYDQSGNGRNATQTTASLQPQIVSSGSVILENGYPAIQFDGSNDGFVLSIPSPSSLGGASEYSVVSRSTSLNPILTFNDGAASNLYSFWILPALGWLSRFGTGLQNFGNPSSINQMLISINRKASTTEMYRNNSLINDLNNSALSANSFVGFGSGPQATNGKIQESILYPSNQASNRTGIETNINTYYAIY
jgi:hypothetical protein